MELDKNILKLEMRSFVDKEFTSFDGFPSSLEESREAMAEAVYQYARTVTPVTTTAEIAKEAMISSLGDMSKDNQIIAFSQFATTLASGMGGFTATPPPSPIVLDSVAIIGLSGGSSESCMTELSNVVDAWMSTGIAINNSTGVTINWS